MKAMVTTLRLLLFHIAKGLVQPPIEFNAGNNRFIFCVQVVAKTLNQEILRCCFADSVKEMYLSACRTCSTRLFSLIQQIRSFAFCRRRCRLRCLNSVLAPIICGTIDLVSVRIVNLDNAVIISTDGPRPNQRHLVYVNYGL